MIGDASSAVKARCDLSMLRRAIAVVSGKTPASAADSQIEGK
jgi:hypothetical protein